MIRLLTYLLSFFPLMINTNRCYLCSQETLPECIGDASIYSSVLQYYTEPCHGQCVLFRNENQSIIRGCSWTYGHMTRKPIGWHEISPGIPAYFCDSFLCNNGTYIQPEVIRPMVLLASNNPQQMRYRSTLKQCYSCTERFQGCGEFLDLHYAMKYIRACPTSCVLFRNPNDLNLITRDCSIYLPHVNGKNGLQKLFGTDAFFCEESLCNGISFDFIMNLYNEPSPKTRRRENRLVTTINIYNDSSIWDDPDLDEDTFELNTTQIISPTTTSIVNLTTIEIVEDDDSVELINTTTILTTENTTETIEHTSPSTTTMINLFAFLDPSFVIPPPPLSWMFSFPENTTTTTTTSTVTTVTTTTASSTTKSSYEYCKGKQCHYGGRLTSDCLCICLPAFTGENCEIALCEDESGDICAFILEHECEDDHTRYLCPRFCQLDVCSSTSDY